MSHPNSDPTIRAIIPHADDPSRYIVDETGQHPTATFHPDNHRTWEGTFHHIGRVLGLLALSVDRRIPGDEIVYHAKPVDHTLAPDSGYRWQAEQ